MFQEVLTTNNECRIKIVPLAYSYSASTLQVKVVPKISNKGRVQLDEIK